MTRVPWDSLHEKQYEDMVSVLLSHLHPSSTRIDGSGGDGGRDVQILTTDGMHAFELKSFTGRLGSARRGQVKKSLLRATALSPTDWTVIVPTDLTPAELRWFGDLRKIVGFPIDYKGLTWLDAQFAERPFIARYFLEDAANEVVRLAKVLNQEKAVLAGGAPDALERVAAVADQLNELDPFYRFEITAGEGTRSVKVIPRYKGAENDRPIEGKFKFRFPNDEAGQRAAADLERALGFGTRASVSSEYIEEANLDLPGQLGGSFDAATLEIGPSEVEASPVTLILASSSPDGKRLAELPLLFRLRSHGVRGSISEADDPSGTLSAVLTADVRDRKFNLTLRVRPVESYFPHEMWPVARFLASFARPNRMSIHTEDGERLGALTEVPSDPWIEAWMPQLVEDLVIIQASARMVRKVPGAVRVGELSGVQVTAALLRGEQVRTTWEKLVLVVSDSAADDERATLFSGEQSLVLITGEPHRVQYAGVEYLFDRSIRMEYEAARLGGPVVRTGDAVEIGAIPDEWRGAGMVPSGAEIVFVPGSKNTATLSLVSNVADATTDDTA